MVAKLSYPNDVTLASDGSLYIADQLNDRIRRVSPAGIITTVAGNGERGFTGDGGPATAAALNRPNGVVAGGDGSLYIADEFNDRIRRVTPSGTITTVAGNGERGFGGDGGPGTGAALSRPNGVAVGSDGSLYVADQVNNRIRRVSPTGMISTVAGNGGDGFSGDNSVASAAELSSPNAVAVATDGSVYIADSGNNRIRRLSPQGIITTVAGRSARP
jgi:glucose/arabinose dehydrogenase